MSKSKKSTSEKTSAAKTVDADRVPLTEAMKKPAKGKAAKSAKAASAKSPATPKASKPAGEKKSSGLDAAAKVLADAGAPRDFTGARHTGARIHRDQALAPGHQRFDRVGFQMEAAHGQLGAIRRGERIEKVLAARAVARGQLVVAADDHGAGEGFAQAFPGRANGHALLTHRLESRRPLGARGKRQQAIRHA